jgi:hypothetical protein
VRCVPDLADQRLVAYSLSALRLQLGADQPLMLEAVRAQGERLAADEAAAVKHRHEGSITIS